MKKISILLLTSFWLFSCSVDEGEKQNALKISSSELTTTEFVKGSQDIPLLDGLGMASNGDLNFDSNSGSISNIDYNTNIDLEEVQNFYLKTLPEMGWRLVKNDLNHSKFVRETESVEINFIVSSSEDEADIVRFLRTSTPPCQFKS